MNASPSDDMAPSSKDAQINIIGAGIFGLSTALHLARRGYKNVTVFDKQPYDATKYSYFNGCDAASAGKCTLLVVASAAYSVP